MGSSGLSLLLQAASYIKSDEKRSQKLRVAEKQQPLCVYLGLLTQNPLTSPQYISDPRRLPFSQPQVNTTILDQSHTIPPKRMCLAAQHALGACPAFGVINSQMRSNDSAEMRAALVYASVNPVRRKELEATFGVYRLATPQNTLPTWYWHEMSKLTPQTLQRVLERFPNADYVSRSYYVCPQKKLSAL